MSLSLYALRIYAFPDGYGLCFSSELFTGKRKSTYQEEESDDEPQEVIEIEEEDEESYSK